MTSQRDDSERAAQYRQMFYERVLTQLDRLETCYGTLEARVGETSVRIEEQVGKCKSELMTAIGKVHNRVDAHGEKLTDVRVEAAKWGALTGLIISLAVVTIAALIKSKLGL